MSLILYPIFCLAMEKANSDSVLSSRTHRTPHSPMSEKDCTKFLSSHSENEASTLARKPRKFLSIPKVSSSVINVMTCYGWKKQIPKPAPELPLSIVSPQSPNIRVAEPDSFSFQVPTSFQPPKTPEFPFASKALGLNPRRDHLD
uniref:AlNc14C67G4727 protein n=1 Tax=Albugo laibachii Nc14 TaxID=890382 RepID=F0WDK8_9STRA|nr:AlNc14C67G4727 [Albugo laibachii Nc14]|eukprot:CCA19282.1 AlNc14C67G4727 [Albugo laibachii Nc14]